MLLFTYLGRVPDGLSPQADYADDAALDVVHLAWAGPTGPGQPLYYRLQGPRLLIEYDNTQRQGLLKLPRDLQKREVIAILTAVASQLGPQ